VVNKTLEFRARPRCPSCGKTNHKSVWSGKFSDPLVTGFLEKFHYSSDTESALGDQDFDLVKCGGCGLMYHRLVMSDAAIPVVYSEWTDSAQVERFEQTHGRAEEFEVGVYRTKLILRLKKLLEGRFNDPLRLLDFGCGSGRTIAQASMFGIQAQGIDVSDTRAEQASILNCQVFSSLDAFDQHGGGKVHAVIMEQVLEHLIDPLDILSALHERLLPGGVLYIAVPNCTGKLPPTDFATFHNVQPVEHVNAFTPATLTTIGENAGFSKERWPGVFVSTGVKGAIRTAGGMVHRPENTEQFFRRS